MDARPYLLDLDRDELRRHVAEFGMPGYRADQLLSWVHGRAESDLEAMSDLSRDHRRVLGDCVRMPEGRAVEHQIASDGVQKLLVAWGDGPQGATQAECVMIPAEGSGRERRTACVSSQAGCPVGCRFCASGIGGLEKNLSAGQIVEQVWLLNRLGAGKISHVVFMGMGEPLANFDQVVRAVKILMSDWATGLSGRRITVSTVGLPAQIRRLARLDLPLTLAISLHAPNDDVRRALIPWAKQVSIEQLVDAGRDYFERTGREVTLEYILLRQVNDRPEHAHELARVAEQLRSNVNLIRYNEVKGLDFSRPASEDVYLFQEILRRAGVNCHIRASRGRDIAAACGQLRHEK